MATEGTFLDLGGAVHNVAHSAFGAKGDVRFAEGGTMTAGSPTLNVATNTFTSSDVGKVIWVPGADTSGRTLSHLDGTRQGYEDFVTISGYVSPTQVTLSKSAATSVTGQKIGFGSYDNPAIQAAVDTVSAAGGGRVLCQAGRIYLVRNVIMRPGVTLDLNGATLIRPANNGVWRTVSVPESGNGRWGGPLDSAPITIRNGILDGNRTNQGPYTNYELQQGHLMFFDADPAQAGRLRVNVQDMVLQECVADGVTIFRNVDIQISNVRAMDCWRGGLVAGGGYSRLRVNQFMTGGYVHDSGIDLEIDQVGSEGFGGSKAVDVQMNSVWVQGDFDIELQPGGVLIAENIICKKPGFIVGGLESTVRISNSEFVVGTFPGSGSNGNRIVWPSDMTFSNCTFTVQPEAPNASTPFNLAAARVAFRAGYAPANQTLRLIDCKFRLGAGVKESDSTYAIWVEEDALSLNNELVVQGCDIPSGFDVGVRAVFGLRATIRDTRIRAAKPIHWDANEGDSGIDLVIDDLDVQGARFYMAAGDGYPGSGIKRIVHRNTAMDEADAGVSSIGGFHMTTYVGGRTIRVASSPVGRLAGMPGDVAELEAPVAGQPWRWVCTQTHSLADGTVWKAEAALGA